MCLARYLTQDTPVGAALKACQRQRFLHAARVVLQSRAVGEHIHHPAGIYALLRNAIFSAKTPAQFYGDMAWLYGDGLAA